MSQFAAYSPADIRATIGVSVKDFASIVGCSRKTVTRWESTPNAKPLPVYHLRLRQVLRTFHNSRSPRWQLPKSYVNPERMAHYLAQPGSDYRHWTWKKRLSFMACRAKYQRIIADAQAGRCIIEYRTLKAKEEVTVVTEPLTSGGNRGNSGNRAEPVGKERGRKPDAVHSGRVGKAGHEGGRVDQVDRLRPGRG